ncbi:MAG: carbohydrate-binding domain-containing protein [Clostridia bacterium]|nr:carbohydrate-binding domain-containing protein [Clostridia bacterium]
MLKKHTKSMKTVLSVLLCFAMILAISIPVSAAAAYDTANATTFVFSDSGITAAVGSYTGYKIDGTALTINGSGTYIVSGSCADGSIKIKKGATGVVLILNGLTLTSSDTAPIACNKSTAVTIVAAAGTVNTLTDSAYNNDDNYPENENAENAVIKTKDGAQVTICGTGTINIVSNGKNGIKGGATTDTEGAAWLTIQDVTLNITANVNDGLKSDQELNILSGNITVNAADDGIKSDLVLNIGAEGTAGPTILVGKSYEGIEAATLNIYSGKIEVHATDDGINAANSDLTNYSFACNIYGGTVYVDASNGDGIDSNGALNLAGGTVEVFSQSGGDNSPLDADGTLTLGGATVLAVGAVGMQQAVGSAKTAYVTFGGSGMGGFGGFFGGMGGGSSIVSAGSTMAITDASGNTVYTAKAVRAASYVFFTSPALTSGSTYTLNVNNSSAATATASTNTSGGMGGQPGGNRPGGNGGSRPGQGGSGNIESASGFLQKIIEFFRNLFATLKKVFSFGA